MLAIFPHTALQTNSQRFLLFDSVSCTHLLLIQCPMRVSPPRYICLSVPSLHRHYPTSSLLWTNPTADYLRRNLPLPLAYVITLKNICCFFSPDRPDIILSKQVCIVTRPKPLQRDSYVREYVGSPKFPFDSLNTYRWLWPRQFSATSPLLVVSFLLSSSQNWLSSLRRLIIFGAQYIHLHYGLHSPCLRFT